MQPNREHPTNHVGPKKLVRIAANLEPVLPLNLIFFFSYLVTFILSWVAKTQFDLITRRG